MIIKKKLFFLTFSISILLISLLTVSCTKKKKAEKAVPGVIVIAVAESPVVEGGTIIGQVVAKEEVELEARVVGFLVKKCVADGQMVKKRDILYQIEKAEYKADLQSAQANLESKQAVLKVANIEYKRKGYLTKNHAVSQEDFDVATCNKETANADVLDAEAKIEIAKLNLSYTDIIAPFNGQIGNTTFSVGDLIGPGSNNSGMPITSLVQLDPIRVEFSFAESTLIGIMENNYFTFSSPENKELPKELKHVTVKLKLSNGSKFKHAGVINFIDNHVDPATGTVKMRALFKNPDHLLRPGAYVNAFIASDKKVNTLLIPQACILQDQGGKYVLTVDKNNKVKAKDVVLGEIYDEYIAVIKGLVKGELLVKEGLQKVREGEIVNPKIDNTKPDFGNNKEEKTVTRRPRLEENKQVEVNTDKNKTENDNKTTKALNNTEKVDENNSSQKKTKDKISKVESK
jgi:membrane fusion protein, multidrug efflux system